MTQRTRRRASLTVMSAVTSAVTLTACGTTVASSVATGGYQPGQASAGTGSGLAGFPGASSAVGTDTGAVQPGATTSGGVVTATGGGSSGSVDPSATVSGGTTGAATSSGQSTASAGLVPSRQPGVTDKYVYVGFPYSSDAQAANSAIGAAGAARRYDDRDVWNAAFDYANKHGGYAGRQLKPLWYDISVSQDINTQEQAACEEWTKDNKVFAMLGGDIVLNQCAENAHAISLANGGYTTQTQKTYPHLLGIDSLALERVATATVNGLHHAGYFAGKLGLVTWDDANYRRSISQGYDPTLASHGLKATETAYITVPQQVGALSDMSAAVSSAITKFRSLGIDHVIIQDGPAGVWSGAGLTFEWMNQAKSQQYYPRYGQNTYNAPGWSVLPADQMDKAIAIDDSDNAAKRDMGWRTNTVREKCFQIQKDAGYPVSDANENEELWAAIGCDIAFLLQRVMNSLTVIDADAFMAALPAIGTTLGSATVYGTKWVSGRHDNGGFMRPAEYYAECQCLKYLGRPSWAI